MEGDTMQQLERLREESRALDRQTKSLPVLLSITLLPIAIICAFTIFPEDSKGVLFLGKLWIAGILIGLMICDYLAAALGQTMSIFRKYWPSLMCGLVVAIPPVVAAASHVTYGLALVQWSVTVGVFSCGIGLYLYLVRTKQHVHKFNFNTYFLQSFVSTMILYGQLQVGLLIAQNFPRTAGGQIIVCLLYYFIMAMFRRVSVMCVPLCGSLSCEILSVYFSSMTFRILTIFYYKNWGVFSAILVIEILVKFLFYSCQLSDWYLTTQKRLHNSIKKLYYRLPSRFQRYSNLGEDAEDFIPIPLDTERENLHKNVSFLCFLQTHADVYIGLGLAVMQLAIMKLVGASALNCFSAYFDDFITLMWKYAIVSVAHIVFVILFYIFAAKVLKKPNFSPMAEGTANVSLHHTKILFTNIAMFIIVFILFFRGYGATPSDYCPPQ